MQYIDKYTEESHKETMYIIKCDALEMGQLLNFVDLSNLKEEVDKLFSEEQSRILQESLLGDYVCDGCTI